MGFGLIIAGLVFLFNPCYNIVDVLPDFIGFFLIFRGLTKISALDPDVGDARFIFSRLALIDLSKVAAYFFLVWGRGGSTLGPDGVTVDAASMRAASETYVLLFTFVYAVIEIIFFTSATRKLFSGLDGLARRFPAAVLNETRDVVRKTRGGSVTEKRDAAADVRNLIIAFFAVRCACSVVCELPALALGRFGDVTVAAVNYRPYLYVATTLAVVAFGAVFLYRSVGFFRRVRGDRPFVDALRAASAEFASLNPEIRVSRRMRAASLSLMFSVFLSVRISDGGAAVVPGAVCAAFLIITSLLIRDAYRGKFGFLKTAVPAAVYGVVGTVSYALGKRYFLDYDRFDAVRVKGAARLYPAVAALEIVGAAVLAVAVVFTLSAFIRLVRSHVAIAGDDLAVSDTVTFRVDSYRRELDGSLKKRGRVARTLAVVHFVILASAPAVEPLLPVVFPTGDESGIIRDLPGQIASYATFAYFIAAAAYFIAALAFCLFANSEIYRPIVKRER